MENIKWQDIGPNDYLLGKGGFLQEQVGNIRFRDGLINVLKPAYQSTRKTKEKQGIVKDIIQSWKHNGGRFLKQQDENDAPDDALWNDITDNVKLVEETIKQKLREKPKTKKKKKQPKNAIVSPPVSPIPTAAVSVLAHDTTTTAPPNPPFPLERATVAPDDPSLVAVYTNAVTPPHEMVDHNMIEDDDYNNHNIVENNNYQEEQQKQLNQQQQDDLKEQYRRLAMMAMHSHGILTVPDFMEENTQQQQEQQNQQNFLDLLSNVASEQELINLLQQNAPLPVEGRQVSVSHRSLTAPPAFMVESLKSVLSNMSEEEFVKVSTSCRNVYNNNNPTQGITRYYSSTTTEENNEINNNNTTTTTNGDYNGGHDRNIILQTTANNNNNVMTFQGIPPPPVNRYEETKQEEEEEEEIFSRSKSFSLSIADECALEMDTHIANGLEGTLQQQQKQQQQQEYHIYDPQGDMAIQIGSTIHSSAQMSLSDIEAHLNREADKQEAVVVANEEGYLTSWIPSGLFHHDFPAAETTTRSATNKARRKRYVFICLVVIIILMIVVIVLRLKDKNSKNE